MDAGMKSSGRDALRRIFEAAHYRVENLDEPLALSAYGDGEVLIAMISDDAQEIEQFNRTNYRLEEGDKTIVCKKVLFTLVDGRGVDNCIVWRKEDFMRYAGAAALATILGQRLDLQL
ncbi:MAG TPA: hypothetical protein VE134_09525, partial [Methanomicrobiales archaeon]|nr:hypothetical protein [Methanomicrobiales archaeon]